MSTTLTIASDSLPGSYWEWQGHSIYYVRAGESHPKGHPIVLIHGFGASTDHWRKNAIALSADFE
ncbi:MAG: alpha/beta hydrolase, partial [Okeania sp. SIO2H7]|nr:alpha/beta hydrolase [Okeania sp. SIO2H7]